MMLHIIVDGSDGTPRSAGAIPVDSLPNVGDVVTMETSSEPVKLEVIETHHTSKRLSHLFSEETDWAYCRRA